MRYFLSPGGSLATLAIAMMITGAANAALVKEIYDDFTLQYDDAVMTLFGTPYAGGSTVFFLPTNFEAFLPSEPSENSTRQTEVHDTTSFGIFPHGNQIITGLNLVEQGDFSHLGGGVSDGYVVHGRVFVRDANNPVVFASTPFQHQFTDVDMTILDVWELQQEIETPGLSSDVWITIENFMVLIDSGQGFSPIPTLPPQGGFGSEMFIQKKFIGFEVGVAPVPIALTAMPIPAAFWFMSSALAALGVVKRRAS